MKNMKHGEEGSKNKEVETVRFCDMVLGVTYICGIAVWRESGRGNLRKYSNLKTKNKLFF